MKNETKTCFVMMPITDPSGYDDGHFGCVYEHLLKPACTEAGYASIRADEVNKTNYIIIDILRRIVESDLVICDLSSRNPNVLYELGIRQAFNKPVVLVCDNKTDKIFDIQGLRCHYYDKSLRIDSVQKSTVKIAELLIETAKHEAGDINSIVQLLGIEAATLPVRNLSEESSILYTGLKDLSTRMSALEKSISGKKGRESIHYCLPNGEEVEMGTEIFVNGDRMGNLYAVTENSVHLIKKDGRRLKYPLDSKEAENLSSCPF